MDTIVKYVLVKDGCDASFQGLYFGAFTSAPSDSFFVSFKRKDNENWLPDDCMELWLRGVNGDFNDSCRVNEYGATDNYIKVADDYCATNEGIDDPIGSFYFDISNGTVSGSYDLQFWDGSQETIVNRIFNGRKIN